MEQSGTGQRGGLGDLGVPNSDVFPSRMSYLHLLKQWWFPERWRLLTLISFLDSLFAGSVLVADEITKDLLILATFLPWGEGAWYLFCL